MDVDSTLESFRVPDLHPKSQERPPKSGRVTDLFLNTFFCEKNYKPFLTFEDVPESLDGDQEP